MRLNQELGLLIKSRYPVIFFETVDEPYAIRQVRATAAELGFIVYQWSLTEGLVRTDGDGAYYQTKEPVRMLRMVLELLKPRQGKEDPPGLFIFKDVEKYLKDALTLRLFKDVINQMRNTSHTCVIVSAAYALPKEIESDAARITGGYPGTPEIKEIIEETVAELRRTSRGVTLSLSAEEYADLIRSLTGLSTQHIRSILTRCIVDDDILCMKDIAAVEAYKRRVFDQEGLLEFYVSEDKNAIAGFDNLKGWLADRAGAFSSRAPQGLPPPKGVMLMGVQGCGKSLAIKVIARELCLPLYRLDLGRLYSKYIGETEQNLRKALRVVEKLSPACLWIDEIEKGFAESSGTSDGGVSQRVLGTFLTWMQERRAPCFIAATANNIDRLPPEFLRKGRFDEVFFVDLPDVAAREELFRIHFRKRGLDPEQFDSRALAAATPDFSGAEIEELIIASLYRAAGQQEPLRTEHVQEKIAQAKPLAVLKSEEIVALRQWALGRTVTA